jgi:hypothetical protein
MKNRFGFIVAFAILMLVAAAAPIVSVHAGVAEGGLYGRYWKDSFFGVYDLIYPNWDDFTMPPSGPYTQPDMVQTDATINFGWDWRPFGPEHQFSVKWTGYITITEPGTYQFLLYSDDGSWLFIDSQLVINNGGVHAPSTMSGSTYLTEGSHEIVVDFYETADSECGVFFYWTPPGATDWAIVPSTVLTPAPLPNPAGGVPEFSLAMPLVTSLGLVIYLALRRRIGKT